MLIQKSLLLQVQFVGQAGERALALVSFGE
jgi:hypothetical protein